MFVRSTCRLLSLQTRRAQSNGNLSLNRINSRISPVQLHLLREFQQGKRNASANVPAIRILWRKLFGKYLLLTNVLSSGILMVVGDVIAQEIEVQKCSPNARRYDWERIGRMFIVGALQGPLHHYAYAYMDRLMPVANAGNALRKILLDQIIMSPACILLFFYPACYLEKMTLQETNHELRAKFGYIYLMDWALWPPMQYINFRYLDPKYRVVYVNVCTALYNILLSYMKHDFEC